MLKFTRKPIDKPIADKNVIIQDDCLNTMRYIASNSIDMILCDLPYGTTHCKWDSIIPIESIWKEYKRIIKNNGAIVLTAAQPFTTMLISSNINEFKYNMVWIKPQGVDPFMSKIRPLNNIEDILIFSNGTPTYNPQKTVGKPYIRHRDKDKTRIKETSGVVMKETITVNSGDRLPTRTLEFNLERGLHPTQKPVALFEYLIRTYTNERELVLDNTAGSMTTAIACINSNRNFICIEKESEYFEKGKSRILKHLAKKGD